MKILAINVAFHNEAYYKRWRLISNEDGVSVVLIGPYQHIYKNAGKPIVYNSSDIKDRGFKALHVDMSSKKYLRHDWWDWKLVSYILKEKPDLVYLIGYESRNALLLTRIAQFFTRKKFKIGLFSMRGKDIPEWNKEFMWRWKLGKKWYDFIHVHYPEGKRVYEQQIGFEKPICLSTQIGFDRDIYFPNKTVRGQILTKYGIDVNEFVFSAAMRIEESKGLYTIIKACILLKSEPFRFLLMGDGEEMDEAREMVKEHGLQDKLILLGRVNNGEEVANHLNASDCFVHVPMNTKKWVDTFPLAVVQAMGCSLPVLGTESGGVPYQTGYDNPLLVPENDSEALADKMRTILSGTYDLKLLGVKALERGLNCFEIRHLNKCLIHNFRCYVNGDSDLIPDIVF